MDERAPGTISLTESRRDGETSWELPPWGHPIGAGVYPFLISLEGRQLPVGTAFCVSRIGLIASAVHNPLHALEYHPRGDYLKQQRDRRSSIDFGDIGFSVLHNWISADNTLQVNIWPLEGAHGAHPTDLVFGSARFQQSFPYLPLRLSFAVPRIGSRVICVGYTDTAVESGALSNDALRSGAIADWPKHYHHRLRAVEGTVRHIFTQGFAPSGYLRGACFEIDVEVASGMSGGPVFNEDGFVCGVVSATASGWFDRPSSLVSLFYPALMTDVTFGFQMGPMRMNATHPLIALTTHGTIVTDGSESMVGILPEEEGWRIGPLIHDDDREFVFDDFRGLQMGLPAQRETRPVLMVQSSDG
jgi:hypothetical protein